MLPTAESGAVGGGCISWQSPHPEHATWRRHFPTRFSCFSRFQPRSADGIAGACAWFATAGKGLRDGMCVCGYVGLMVLDGLCYRTMGKGKRRGIGEGEKIFL